MTALSIPCTSHEQALAVIQHGWAVVDGDWIERWIAAGKPRIPVTAPCQRCQGSGAVAGGYPDYDALDCPMDCVDGTLHVGWVTVTELLPVVANTGNPPQTIPCIVNIGDGVVVHFSGDQFDMIVTDITADVAHLGNPGDLIGRFLLKCEVVA